MSADNKLSLIYDLIVDERTDQACATEEENSAPLKELLIHPLLKRPGSDPMENYFSNLSFFGKVVEKVMGLQLQRTQIISSNVSPDSGSA